MNYDALKVVIRTQEKFISATLELDSKRAFAIIHESRTNNPKEDHGEERMELDVQFLEKISETEYFYKTLVDYPVASRSKPARLSRPTRAL